MMASLVEKLKGRVEDISIDPYRTYSFLREVEEELVSLYGTGRKGRLVRWNRGGLVFFVGDIHGDYDSLVKIVSRLDEQRLSSGETGVVFLGDYVDRGPRQLESLLLVLELWRMYPESVVVLRGNHEPPRHLIPYPHDFPENLVMRFGYQMGVKVYEAAQTIFEALPIAVVINDQVLCLHGGLPTTNYRRAESLEEYILGSGDHEYMKILTEILWNDPVEDNVVRIPSPRGAGYLWGRPVTRWVSEEFNISLVVRGHEPASSGYKLNHDGMVLTLFSRRGPPYNNDAAAILAIELDSEPVKNILDHLVFL